MTSDDQHLDGNAAGGVLGQIFAFEMTTAEAICAHCDAVGPIGAQSRSLAGPDHPDARRGGFDEAAERHAERDPERPQRLDAGVAGARLELRESGLRHTGAAGELGDGHADALALTA